MKRPGGGYQPEPGGTKPVEGPKSGSGVTALTIKPLVPSKADFDFIRMRVTQLEYELNETKARLRGYQQKPHPSDLLQVALKQAEERVEEAHARIRALDGWLNEAEKKAERAKSALIVAQNEMLAATKEHDQKLDAVKKKFWDDLEDITEERDRARKGVELAHERIERLLKTGEDLREQRAAYEKQIDTLNESIRKKNETCARVRHAVETLQGRLALPEIEELRRVRGLEPLSTEGR